MLRLDNIIDALRLQRACPGLRGEDPVSNQYIDDGREGPTDLEQRIKKENQASKIAQETTSSNPSAERR